MSELTRVTGSILGDDIYRRKNNLNDVPDKAAARNNLGVYSKTETDNKIDSKDSLPDQTGADGKFLGSDGTTASWEDISIPAGLPIAAIIPYYGSSAPMGWLGLTKGATISKADYLALYEHLVSHRKAPYSPSAELSVTDSKAGIFSGLSIGKYFWEEGTNNVILISEFVANLHFKVTLVSGVITEGRVMSGSSYDSLTDIPLPNDECFLPDAANNFIKGYEPSGEREMGTFEQDAIRKIEGGFTGIHLRTIEPTGLVSATLGNPINIGGGGDVWRDGTIGFDSSRVVPTAPENVPKNLNCLWIIKAYDAVNDPEQLQAKAVIDQVNKNSSEILAVTGTANRLDESTGYTLLDLGTVVKNTRYVKPNPFGNNTPVYCVAEILLGGIWANPNATFEYAHGGRGVMASYVESEGIIVRTAGTSLNREPYSTSSAHLSETIVSTAPCRVHVWRVKG